MAPANMVEVVLSAINSKVKCVVDLTTYEKLLNDSEYRDNFAVSMANKNASDAVEETLAFEEDINTTSQEDTQDMQKNMQDNIQEDTLENSVEEDNTDDDVDETKKWNAKTTKLLIENRLQLDAKFRNPKAKKLTYWKLILKVFHQHNYMDFTAADLVSKWKNILVTYNRNIDKLKKTGESAITWQYFEMLHESLGKRRNVIPPETSLGSSMKATSSPQSEMNANTVKPRVALSEKGQTEMQLTSKHIALESTENNGDLGQRRSLSTKVQLFATKKDSAVKKRKLNAMSYVTETIKEKNADTLAFKENLWKEKKDIEKEKINAIRELAAAIGSLKQK